MQAILTFLAIFLLLLSGIALAIFRSRAARWFRFLLAGPFIAGIFLTLVLAGGLLWGHYSLPTEKSVVAQLEKIGEAKDRSIMVSLLRKQGFSPMVYEEEFRPNPQLLPMDPPSPSRFKSYLLLQSISIRPPDFFSQYMVVTFLFDGQEKLIRWNYWIHSPMF